MMRREILLGLCMLAATVVGAQTMVYLHHSETLEYDAARMEDAQILKGNVIFRHDSAWMYCDSAYFYEGTNSLDAFGHVRFIQGDTLRGYGDKLYYDGNTKIARLRNHVRLVHGLDNPTILTTDSLNYERQRNLAYYYTGGTIRDSLNTLTSRWGQYNPASNRAVFRTNVKLKNDRFQMESDTLNYNTATHLADIVGPTTVLYEKETTIRSVKGWYNTENERSMLLQRSTVAHSDGKCLTGDTIYYDKRRGHGKVIGHFEMQDTVQKATLYGNVGELFDDGAHGYATDSALMVDWSDSTAYAYMHADSLFVDDIPYKMPLLRDSAGTDTLWCDTTARMVRAFYGVRAWREDMQMVCDSAVYDGRDSVLTIYKEPISWSEDQQLSADTVRVFVKNGTVDYIHGVGSALTVKKETQDWYDQLSGKEMKAWVREGDLREVEVNGNALTVFYPIDESDSAYVGMNTTQSSYVRVYLKEQKVERILFTAETTGMLYPMDQIPAGKDRLAGFFWAEDIRPTGPEDVFRRTGKVERPKAGSISAAEELPEEEKPAAVKPIEKRRLKGAF